MGVQKTRCLFMHCLAENVNFNESLSNFANWGNELQQSWSAAWNTVDVITVYAESRCFGN